MGISLGLVRHALSTVGGMMIGGGGDGLIQAIGAVLVAVASVLSMLEKMNGR